MKTFDLRNLCNEILTDLNQSPGKKNIIKLGIDIQLPDCYHGNPLPLSESIRLLAGYMSASLVNGIINIEITQHMSQDSLVTLNVYMSGRGTNLMNGDKDIHLENIAARTGIKIGHRSNENHVSFEFLHGLKSCASGIPEETLAFRNKKILLVEDNDINALVFSSFLEEWGCESTTAVNGGEAVSRAHDSLFPFDAILMDIHMPVLNGIEATRKIRLFNTSIPIIALTASTRDEDFREAIAAGANDFLLKPVSSTQLYQVLAKFL